MILKCKLQPKYDQTGSNDRSSASNTAYVYASVFHVVRANTTSTVTASVPFSGPFDGDPYEYWDGRTRAYGPLLDDVVTQLEYFGVSHISDCVAGSYTGSPTLIVPLSIYSAGCQAVSPARPQESIDSVPGVVAEPLTIDSADGAPRLGPTGKPPDPLLPPPPRPQISINMINSPSAAPLPGVATPASPGGPAITAGPAAVFGIPDRPQERPSPGGDAPESPLPSPGGQETPAPGNEGPGSVDNEGAPSPDNEGGSQVDTPPLGQSQDQSPQPPPQPRPEDQSPAPGGDNPTMLSIPPVVLAPPVHTTVTVGGIPVVVSSDQVILPSTTYFPSSGAAPATITISNTPIIVNPSQIIAGDSTIAIPSQGPKAAGGLPTAPATPPVYIAGSQTFAINPASEVVIAGQTVRPGGPGIVVGSQTFSLAPSASAIVVGGQTYPLTLPAFPSPTGALATSKITVGGETYTANPAGEFVVGTQTITPGSPAVTISGTPISIAPHATQIVVGSSTIAQGGGGGGGDGGLGGMIMSAFGAGPTQSAGSTTSASDTGNRDVVPTGISTDAEASPTVSGNAGGGQTSVVGFLPGSGAARWNVLDKRKIWGMGILGLTMFIGT